MTSDPFNVAATPPRPTSSGQSMGASQPSTTPPSARGANESNGPPQSASLTSKNGQTPEKPSQTNPAEMAEQVKQAVERINEMMQNGQQSLRFAVDEDSGRTVVRVMDARTEEVIRQIPSEETLRFAEYVDGLVGMIFNKKA